MPQNLQLLCCACHRLKCWRELAFRFLGHNESVREVQKRPFPYFKHLCKNGYEEKAKIKLVEAHLMFRDLCVCSLLFQKINIAVLMSIAFL